MLLTPARGTPPCLLPSPRLCGERGEEALLRLESVGGVPEGAREERQKRYGPTQNAAMRCRPETPKTKRCTVARKETMRCRFAPTHGSLPGQCSRIHRVGGSGAPAATGASSTNGATRRGPAR